MDFDLIKYFIKCSDDDKKVCLKQIEMFVWFSVIVHNVLLYSKNFLSKSSKSLSQKICSQR